MVDLEILSKELSKLTIMEASNLVKILEKKWDVKANTNTGIPAMAIPEDKIEKIVEKTEFDLELTEIGNKKIQVIKVVRVLTGLGLKEAKDMVDSAPKIIKSGISKIDAESMKAKLEEQGAKTNII